MQRADAAMELPAIPAALRAVLSRLPSYPPAFACAAALNVWAADTLSATRLPELRDKLVCIHVRDAGVRMFFRIHAAGVAASSGGQPDATISADARDFLALALRREDPDTLFFARRLLVEGDTEVGLLVKNTLDTVDLRDFLRPVAPGAVLAGLRSALGR